MSAKGSAVKASKYKLADVGVVPRQVQKGGQQPRQIQVLTNHYALVPKKIDQFSKVFLYALKVSPEISLDNRQLRRQLIDNLSGEIEARLGKYYLSGHVLFAQQCTEETLVLTTKVGQNSYDVDLRVIRDRKSKDLKPKQLQLGTSEEQIQFMNSVMKRLMQQNGYKDIGILSKYFDVEHPCKVTNAELQVYRGFYLSIDMFQKNKPLMLVDVSTRVLQSISCLEFIKRTKSKQELEDCVVGNSVIIQYGNFRTFVVDEIVYKMSPNSTFMRNGKEISFKKYYKDNYNITIKDNSQPLLLSVQKQKDAQGNKVDFPVYLVPELCKITGMTERQRRDFKCMRNVAEYTKLFPNQRMQEQNGLLAKLKQSMDFCPMDIGAQVSVSASVFAPPTISLRQTIKPNNGDFKSGMRGPLKDPATIGTYLLAYYKNDYADAEKLAQELKSCSGAYAIRVGAVEWSEMDTTKERDWTDFIEEDFHHFGGKKKIDVVVVLLPFKNGDNIYKAVKELCCSKLNIVSQAVQPKTLQKNTKSVCSNLLLQINAKLGKTLWTVQRPANLPKRTMIVGVDVHHGGAGKKKHSIVGVAATMDEEFTKYYSRIQKQEKIDQEIIYKNIGDQIVDCIAQYCQINRALPENIVIYRDGVGDSMFEIVQKVEISQINAGLEDLMKTIRMPKPKLIYFVVTKLIKDRFFNQRESGGHISQQGRGGRGGHSKVQESQLTNCESGTMVCSPTLSPGGFEFFMMSQNVTQGTCTPTRYVQLANDTSLDQDTIFNLTYFQCFNYYNWPGAVKVPAVVQYAGCCAKFNGHVFKQPMKKEPVTMAKECKLYHL